MRAWLILAKTVKPLARRLVLSAAALVVLALILFGVTGPKHPVALLRVLDAAGRPISGAVIIPDGLRPKPGRYAHGHYGWRPDLNVPSQPMVTDNNGEARVTYPKFVFERIETGQISFSINHPDFVPDRPFRAVATSPPAGAPWREWADYIWNRIRLKALTSKTEPIILQKGAILRLSLKTEAAHGNDSPLFAQVSGMWSSDTNFWFRPEPDTIVTRRLSAGPHTVRAVQFDTEGQAWFSDVVSITATSGVACELEVELKRGVTARGQLDATVPRPVQNGRVIAHVSPANSKPQDDPPEWHTWSAINSDGSFTLDSLPEGNLEIVALCDGFVNKNGPGQFRFRYPQKYPLGSNDLTIAIGMEPTAWLEVVVTDDQGRPLKDAQVSAWPNVRYGEWSATVLGSDCYHTADRLLGKPDAGIAKWWTRGAVQLYAATTDAAGFAMIGNLPAEVNEFHVEHAKFVLPIVETGVGDMRRQASVTLVAGKTNRVTVKLVPRDQSAISHY